MFSLVVIGITLLIYYYFPRRRFFWLLRSIPNYPNGIPVIGQLKIDAKNVNYINDVSTFANNHNGVIKIWLGPFPVIVVTNPEDAEVVLNSCLSKGLAYKFAKPWMGEGLITARASVWKRHIKKLAPAFNQRVLDGFLGIFNEQSSILVSALSSKLGQEPFDMYPYIGAANLETICQTAMGTAMDIQSTPHHPYLDAIEKVLMIITVRSLSIWIHPRCVFNLTKYRKEQDDAIKILHDVSNTVIEKKKKELIDKKANGEVDDADRPKSFRAFLDLMLEINSTEVVFSDEEIREQVDTMIAAGQETSSHVVLYTLLLLGSHADIQEKVYQELREVFGNSARDVKKEDLTKLVYLEAVIKESMRLYPVVPIVFRYIDKELKFSDHIIPKGCHCGISIWGINRHKRWGDDYEVFRPERWFSAQDLPSHPASFASFSYGRRVCLGKYYAMMTMKTMLSHILHNYRVQSDISKLKLNIFFVLKPVSGHYLTIHRRG